MLTLGQFRELTKDLGDEVRVFVAGAEVKYAWIEDHGQGCEYAPVLVLDEESPLKTRPLEQLMGDSDQELPF